MEKGGDSPGFKGPWSQKLGVVFRWMKRGRGTEDDDPVIDLFFQQTFFFHL